MVMSDVIPFDPQLAQSRPLFLSSVAAGFPSPADDYLDKGLDLNEFLVKHPAATFFIRAEGESMINAGIHSGDILVVDRSLEPTHGRIVVAVVNGGFTVKRISRRKGKTQLIAENPDFTPIQITEESECAVWGVVTFVLHPVLHP